MQEVVVLTLAWVSFSVVPHITDAIQEWVMRQARIPVDEDGIEPQVCVIEVCSSFKKIVLFLLWSKLNYMHILPNNFFTVVFNLAYC